MKKIFVMTQSKDARTVLEQLGDLGLVHIEHLETPKAGMMAELVEETDNLTRAVEAVSAVAAVQQTTASNWQGTTADILEVSSEIDRSRDSIKKWQAEIAKWEPWGDFQPKDLEALISTGTYVYLCELTKKDRSKIPNGVIYEVISTDKNIERAVLISRGPVDLPFSVQEPPKMSLQAMRDFLKEEQKELEWSQKKLAELAQYRDQLKAILKEKEASLKLQEIRAGMKEDQGIVILKGFCPAETCAVLEQKAKDSHWGFWITDPESEDRVPTYLRNPRWVEIIKPVFNVINVMPGYKEFDISPVFLIFFSVFFGILIGDAGYGFVFLLLTVGAHLKWGKKAADKTPFFLMYVLSACAMVWGVMTGTIFGTLLLGKAVRPMVEWLTDLRNLQFFCFLIGVIHLSIAHIWRFINKVPSISALAEIGAIGILWGGFFVANMLILGMPLLWFVKYLFIGGAVLILIDIFTQPKNTIFVNIILFMFGIINAFTDVVSYVRLFAVGLAGVAVADAFNEMALGVGFNSFTAGLITSLILVIGHLFNIVLCGFGVLVHGLRLNVLEFSGHLGMEWTGVKYEPFKRNSREDLKTV